MQNRGYLVEWKYSPTRKGKSADFVYNPQKQQIKLYVYGYLMRLLKENNISDDQRFEEFISDEDYEPYAIVTVSIIISGTLLRWLLSFGNNVEVVEPESLRRIVAEQASDMTDYYEDIYSDDEDSE